MKKAAQGFTLVELLVVMAILGILLLVVMVIINPIELTKKSRDTTRLADITNLQQAINVAVQEATNSSTYILCNGQAYPCVDNSVSGTRTNNGTGWVRVNLSASSQSVSVPTLPVDPVNTSGANGYHYLYCAGQLSGQVEGWEIVGKLESQQLTGRMATDGGTDNTLFESGSNLGLLGVLANCTY